MNSFLILVEFIVNQIKKDPNGIIDTIKSKNDKSKSM